MTAKTIRDILSWTKQYHEQLESCFVRGANEADEERVKLLLDYFKSHQSKLVRTLELVIERQHAKVLNSWCAEYSLTQIHFEAQVSKQDLDGLSMDEITGKVVAAHQVVIDLYEELASQTHISETHDLFQSLLDLETHELKQQVVSAHRINDL